MGPESTGYTPPQLDHQASPEGEPGGMDGLGARLAAGGEFLNANTPIDPIRLQQNLQGIAEGTRTVDTTPLENFAAKQRVALHGDKSFNEQYTKWSNHFHNWIIGTNMLRESTKQTDRDLYTDRVATLNAFGIDVPAFSSLSELDRQQTIRSYYDNFGAKTNLPAFTEAVLNSARNQHTEVSVPLLERRLKAIDSLLHYWGGNDVKMAVHAHILAQGNLTAAPHQREQFIRTASTVGNTMNTQEKRILSGVYSAYQELHPPKPPEPREPSQKDKPDVPDTPAEVIQDNDLSRQNNAGQNKDEAAARPDAVIYEDLPEEEIEEAVDDDTSLENEEDDKPDVPDKQEPIAVIYEDLPEDDEEQEEEMREIQVSIGAATKGESPGTPNEDANFASEQHKAAGVFDGVGGRKAGEIASAVGRDTVEAQIAAIPDDMPVAEVQERMRAILMAAHKAILDKVQENPNEYEGMGATASVVKILKDGTVVIVNIGDSRVFALRNGSNELEHLTLDDGSIRDRYKDEHEALTLQKRVGNAKDADDLPSGEGMYIPIGMGDPRVARFSSQLSQYLGLDDEPIVPHVYTTILRLGDVLLLTTDGIHDCLIDDEMISCIQKHSNNPQEAADDLVNKADEVGALIDSGYRRAKLDDRAAIVIAASK